MTPRFRVVAGPNGSGKTTLSSRLAADYAVNFYDVVNADDIFAEVRRTGGYAPRILVDGESLRGYAASSSYAEDVKAPFLDGRIGISAGCVRFMPAAVANAAVALPYLSRAFFFDNSGETMRFFAEWNEDSGLAHVAGAADSAPAWFAPIAAAVNGLAAGSAAVAPLPEGSALAVSAASASHEAIARAFAAGLSVTVMRDGRIVRLSAGGRSNKGEAP